jgi:hypothetical protein
VDSALSRGHTGTEHGLRIFPNSPGVHRGVHAASKRGTRDMCVPLNYAVFARQAGPLCPQPNNTALNQLDAFDHEVEADLVGGALSRLASDVLKAKRDSAKAALQNIT